MFLARVTGSVVATQKVASMTGHKLLIVEPLRVDPQTATGSIGTGRTLSSSTPSAPARARWC